MTSYIERVLISTRCVRSSKIQDLVKLVRSSFTISRFHDSWKHVSWFVYRYDEVCQYNFNLHRYQSGLGHFSQIVWKASTELGIGKYTGRSQGRTCTYIVARYKDAGNVNSPRYFQRNLSKGSFRKSYCNTIADKSVGEDKYIDAPEGSTEPWGDCFSLATC